MTIDELREQVRSVIDDPTLSFHLRRHHLAGLAESILPYPALSDRCREALDKGVICDLFEGNAPYRPRYLLPDYARALAQGFAFLELEPPDDLDDALAFLLIMYTQVPSITGHPVYLGDLDSLLLPYTAEVSDEHLYRSLRRFWISLDRMLPDAFVHTNIGPADNRVARTILRLERELDQIVPNVTLKVDPELTPDDLVEDAVRTVFECGKPHFVNHPMMVRDLGESYGVVSCYNSLPVGGGAHTLVRLNLLEVVRRHEGDLDRFFAETLPDHVELCAELIEARVRHLVEVNRFFEHDFLAVEGLLDLERFTAMYGIFGVAEAVDLLMEHEGSDARYGHDAEANQLSYRLTEAIAELVAARPMPHTAGSGGRCLLHSQSGIDSDEGVTAGTRIPIGTEPSMWEHIAAVAPHHTLFGAGVSDIFHVEDTARRNPRAMVDIIRGALTQGMRDFTFNLATNGFVRITGYLVRKADLESFEECGGRHGSTTFAAGSMRNADVSRRAVKRVSGRER
ncbi:MAG: YjjI family glycine radical enzyme [Actinomycetota bacterium]